MIDPTHEKLHEVIRKDGRYPFEAFAFLQEGLGKAVQAAHGDEAGGDPKKPHHVTGQQLCCALRDEAVERWGLLAGTVLRRWNIRATIDFGNMVYLLVDNGLMHKTDEDSLEDFRDVYDFGKAFGPEQTFKGSD